MLALLAISLSWIQLRALGDGVFIEGRVSAENLEGEFSTAGSQRHGKNGSMNVECEEKRVFLIIGELSYGWGIACD